MLGILNGLVPHPNPASSFPNYRTDPDLGKSFDPSQCFGYGLFFRIRIRLFFLSPDPDRDRIRIRKIRKLCILVLKIGRRCCWYLFSRKFNQKYRWIRIRDFKIRIGQKTRNTDPSVSELFCRVRILSCFCLFILKRLYILMFHFIYVLVLTLITGTSTTYFIIFSRNGRKMSYKIVFLLG